MTVKEVMSELEKMGSPAIKKIFTSHGAREPFFGVKVGDMKAIQKKVKKDYELSKALYATGNSDAMYLAGLIADEKKMTRKDLQEWVKGAYWYMISEYTVAWIAAESAHGWELALEWIDDKEPQTACAGWSTLGSLAALRPDEELDIKTLEKLIARVGKELPAAPNRVRYAMNGFLIAVGSYVPALTQKAVDAALKIGKVQVELGGTACKVPSAPEYIGKALARGPVKKKKTVRC